MMNGRDITDSDLLLFYMEHLLSNLLPFWKRAVDSKGGIFTCFNNAGTKLLSHDKYTWSQGRFIWIWSRIAHLCDQGIIEDSSDRYLLEAERAIDFLLNHAILANGNCAFILSEEGAPKESIPGEGFDTSFYADCFVILGMAEFARVTRRTEILDRALRLYDTLVRRTKGQDLRSEPYPIPQGLRAHSVSMILLNVTQELFEALRALRHPQENELREACEQHAKEVLGVFRTSDGFVREMVVDSSTTFDTEDTVLLQHFNPGHTLEDMWFVIHASRQLEKPEWIPLAVQSVKKALELGWDREYGGLLRFVDKDGTVPRGTHTGDPYEKLILETWDTKLWWPHSEALYVTLLAERVTGWSEYGRLYQQMHDYVFRTFPNPDRNTGEWIQIRNRTGDPVNKLVALPVKDPYHIIRNVLLIIELLSNPNSFSGGTQP